MIMETLQTLQLHTSRADQAYQEVCLFSKTLDVDALDDFEKVKVIDSFIFRFIKIQDLMGNKLFREILLLLGEYESSMSMLDVLDKLEKLKLLESAELWLDYRNLRNVLTHEYPNNRLEIIEGLHMALDVFVQMKTILQTMRSYLQSKHLIKGNI